MNIKHDYQEFNPPYYWEKYDCDVLDSWYDDFGVRHHRCVGEIVSKETTLVLDGAIIHKGEYDV